MQVIKTVIPDLEVILNKVIGDHRGALDAIAKELMEKETVERADFEKILIANGITPKKKEEDTIASPVVP